MSIKKDELALKKIEFLKLYDEQNYLFYALCNNDFTCEEYIIKTKAIFDRIDELKEELFKDED